MTFSRSLIEARNYLVGDIRHLVRRISLIARNRQAATCQLMLNAIKNSRPDLRPVSRDVDAFPKEVSLQMPNIPTHNERVTQRYRFSIKRPPISVVLIQAGR